MTATYDCIATTTLGSAADSVTFSSIPGTYTDLVVVIQAWWTTTTNDMYIYMQFNGDTASNYSTTILTGTGSSAVSTRFSNRTNMNMDYYATIVDDEPSQRNINIMNYANTTTYKTAIWRANRAGNGTDAMVGLWRSTSAITSILFDLESGQFASGSTFTLYGIKSE